MVNFNTPKNKLSNNSLLQLMKLTLRVRQDIMKTSSDVDEIESGNLPRTSIAMVVASTSLASSIDMLGTVMLLRPLGEELSKKLAMIVFDELEKICKDEME